MAAAMTITSAVDNWLAPARRWWTRALCVSGAILAVLKDCTTGVIRTQVPSQTRPVNRQGSVHLRPGHPPRAQHSCGTAERGRTAVKPSLEHRPSTPRIATQSQAAVSNSHRGARYAQRSGGAQPGLNQRQSPPAGLRSSRVRRRCRLAQNLPSHCHTARPARLNLCPDATILSYILSVASMCARAHRHAHQRTCAQVRPCT